ncbi:Glycerophosphocholine phosphodiesterase GPCPD1 [Schistosoma japonicum]|uniref:Glycerophosphocholine phosphodiesterase GPCPD1 n=2 Tax=Schistosoma japonicum TaxID=6182 RepID=A0A4Z2DN26_SCHJA|nr:Glycerophosphocholine phosphodiesterase GPCPD1 [Schistosoma japonicum]
MDDAHSLSSIVLSVDIDFKSLEDVGIYIEASVTEYKRMIVVGITGSLDVLGMWNPEKAVFCERQNTTSNNTETWHCSITLQTLSVFQYRFFLAELFEEVDETSDSQTLNILAWESRLKPREFCLIDYLNSTDKHPLTHTKFGIFDDGNFIQRGWLMSNSEIHIRMSSTSCKFFKNNVFAPHTRLFVSCFRFVLHPTPTDGDDNESLTTSVISTESVCSQKDNVSCGTIPSTLKLSCLGYPFTSKKLSSCVVSRAYPVPMSTLEINRCRIHKGEQPECCGTLYRLGDDVTFFIKTLDVENTSVEIQFYQQQFETLVDDSENTSPSPLKFIGSARFGPFVDTYGRKAAQILNASLTPIGDLRVRYLIIHPMINPPSPSLQVTYQHHWKKRASAGADFVEMDVQLTKDNRVIVYHDFDAVVISKKKRGGQLSYLRVAIKDLNYDDLRELNVRHSSVLKESHTHEKMNEEDLDPVELQPFPLLRSCFEEIDSDLGFVIEVKYPMELKNGGSEMDHFFEYNFYIDTILREILTYAGKRRILLSCFDPNVTVMLQLKQQIYPVFQLGIAPEYADTRHADFEHLFWSALSHQLLGVCLVSDRLLNVPRIIELAHSLKLVVLAWGDAVNTPEKRALLVKFGVDGIIYDCLNENKAKGTLSVFKRERLFIDLSSTSTPPSPIEVLKPVSGLSSSSLSLLSIENNDNTNNNNDLNRMNNSATQNVASDQQCSNTNTTTNTDQLIGDLSTAIIDSPVTTILSSIPSTVVTNEAVITSVEDESNDQIIASSDNCTNTTVPQAQIISTVQLASTNDADDNKLSSSSSSPSTTSSTTSSNQQKSSSQSQQQCSMPVITFA